jgi:hypothetical protein
LRVIFLRKWPKFLMIYAIFCICHGFVRVIHFSNLYIFSDFYIHFCGLRIAF